MNKTNFFKVMFFAAIVALAACSNVNEPEPEPTNTLPFSETFETSLGKFTTQSVVGVQVWAYDTKYKCALIKGYDGTTNIENEDWLISPEINLAGKTAAKLSFEHAGNYFNNLSESTTMWISENYVDGLPSTATWTQLTITKNVTNSDFTFVIPEVSLTPFVGKKIKIAFKYLSNSTKAGTWEIKNFKVEEGEAVIDPSTTGGDTEANAFTVEQGIANQTGDVKWVKGYIVGCVKNGVATFETAADALFGNFDSSTNVFIADNAAETDYTKCLSIKLNDTAAPSDLRSAVNLLDKPENKGKELKVKGALKAMFTSLKGCRDIVDFKLEGYSAPTGDFAVPEMTIAELRAQWTGTSKTITDKKKIVGVVITDLVGGNSGSLKNLTIASTDNSAGIMVRLTANSTYNMGDKIEISVEGLDLNQYGLAIQLNNVPNVKTQKIGTSTITPKITTIANIKSNYASLESTLVTVNGVVTSPNGFWGSASANQNNTLTSGADNLTLYVTKYSTFVATAIPTGEKIVTGIVGQYSTATSPVYQLIIRNLSDVK